MFNVDKATIEKGGEHNVDKTSVDLGSERQIKKGGKYSNAGLAAKNIDNRGGQKMDKFAVEQGGKALLQGKMQTSLIDNKGEVQLSGAKIEADHYEGAASSTMTLANNSHLKGKSAKLAGTTKINDHSAFNVDKATVEKNGQHNIDTTSVDLGSERQIKNGGKYSNGGLAAKNIDKDGRVQKMDKFAVEQGGKALLQGQMKAVLLDNQGSIQTLNASLDTDKYVGGSSSELNLEKSCLKSKNAKMQGQVSAVKDSLIG